MIGTPRVPDFLLRIHPYVPETPVAELERNLGFTVAQLASNENPLGPSPLAVEAARQAVAKSNRYPEADAYYLRERLAAQLGMPAETLVFGNGSTELILLAGSAFLREGDEGVSVDATFPMYAIAIFSAGARLVTVPLCDYRVDLEQLAAAVTPLTRILYVANPNNPTGTLFPASAFESFLTCLPENLLVVLDEAYYEYVDDPGYSRSLDLVRQGRNVLVLRTFSKVYGLAGMRIGYGIARPEIVRAIDRVRGPFNTSIVAQAAALAALDDRDHVRRSLESNRAGRLQLARGLDALGVKFIPSATNFVLVGVGGDAKPVSDAMLKLGMAVRPMAWMGFPNAIRVTVGTAEDNAKFLAALPQTLGGSVRRSSTG